MKPSKSLSIWQKLSQYPGGKWLFSVLVSWKTPYFRSIKPRFVEMRPGYAEVRMKKRWRVQNHIGTVHAIAVCNLAECAAGVMTDSSMPSTHRWIPKGMTVEYVEKAESNLRAVARIKRELTFSEAVDVPVKVDVTDVNDTVVLRALITMWVSPR